MRMAKPEGTVIQFNRRPILEGEEETPVGLPPSSSLQSRVATSVAGVDLTDKPKVWFAVGPGRSGKTMLLRWAAEMAANRGRTTIVAAADPQNRSLTDLPGGCRREDAYGESSDGSGHLWQRGDARKLGCQLMFSDP